MRPSRFPHAAQAARDDGAVADIPAGSSENFDRAALAASA